jgi:hypothetical protein
MAPAAPSATDQTAHRVTSVGKQLNSMYEHPSQRLLDEVNSAGAWTRARKTKSIWARQVDRDQTVDTLEGTESLKAGDFLCRGAADELWPQSAERLEAKYDQTGQVDGEGWREYAPKPEGEGVMAARIDREFSVHAPWGELQGKPGDYLVKDYSDRDTPYPKDVWIVDAKLFQATYEAVDPQRRASED